jgi:hypothetical protein
VVLEYRTTPPNVNQSLLNRSKPKLLPVEIENESFDPVTQVREPYQVVVEPTRVVHRYTVRDKTEEEIAAMASAKCDQIEREFQRLSQLPISFEVGGHAYMWDADQEAIRNITGCLQAYVEGAAIAVTLSDPRSWTPVDSFSPVSISRNELRGLGLTIAGRKDALFVKKKIKEAAVTAMTAASDIIAYDVTTGWN